MKIMKILVPVDFTEESELALEYAAMLTSKHPGATIYLLHVSPSLGEQEAQGFAGVGYLMEETQARTMLQEWLKRLPSGVPGISLFAKGRIPEAIERLCYEKSIDLVIITTRGRHRLQPLTPESTTEETVRVAPCPVLVLHRNAKTSVPYTASSPTTKEI